MKKEKDTDWQKEIRRQIKMGGGETLAEALIELIKKLLEEGYVARGACCMGGCGNINCKHCSNKLK